MAATITNTDSAVSAAGGTSNTYTAKSVGTAAADRYIVVCVTATYTSLTTLSSVTVGGNATTIVAHKENGAGVGSISAICITNAPLTTGATADVVLNFAASIANSGISVYALSGLDRPGAFSTNTAADNTGSGSAIPLSLTTSGGGVAVGVFGQTNTGTVASCTWAGLTKNVDISRASFSDHSTASGTTAGSPLSVTATPGVGGGSVYTGCTAAWLEAVAVSGVAWTQPMDYARPRKGRTDAAAFDPQRTAAVGISGVAWTQPLDYAKPRKAQSIAQAMPPQGVAFLAAAQIGFWAQPIYLRRPHLYAFTDPIGATFGPIWVATPPAEFTGARRPLYRRGAGTYWKGH